MTFTEFSQFINALEHPIILLEGSRALPAKDWPRLVAVAVKIAVAFPHALFRTGNATGSDEAFAEGINGVDPARLQYILPRPSMGRERRSHAAYSVSMDDVPHVEESSLVYQTKQA